MNEPLVRAFETSDTDDCYEICLLTADNGADATALHEDPRLVGEVWVAPYLVRHPECAVVLEDEHGVGGYIVGAPDTLTFDTWLDEDWFVPLREKYPLGTFEAGTADAACVNLIHSPLRMAEEVARSHPAHLHIDLLPRLQGQGFGRALMQALFERVRAAGAPAIHLACDPENTNAIAFYQRLRFEDLVGGFIWGRSTDL